ncbi:hypothetical protein QOT17_010124 [Balamuthia mandrillaris]
MGEGELERGDCMGEICGTGEGGETAAAVVLHVEELPSVAEMETAEHTRKAMERLQQRIDHFVGFRLTCAVLLLWRRVQSQDSWGCRAQVEKIVGACEGTPVVPCEAVHGGC